MRFQIFTRSTTNTNERYIDIDRKTLCCVSGDLLPFIRLENSHQVGKRLIYIVMYYCSIIMVVHFVGIEKLKDSLQTCKIISLPKDMLWQTFFVKVFHGIIGISFSSWRPIHRKKNWFYLLKMLPKSRHFSFWCNLSGTPKKCYPDIYI